MRIEFLKSENPTNIAVSSARSCYFKDGLIYPEQSSNWSRKNTLLESIFKAGHHSTLQHSQITMLIDGVSRHLIWRLLHSHPYYNSEQVSQRYAKMKIENFYYPKELNREKLEKFYLDRFRDYEKLIEILTPDIQKILPKFKQIEAIKKAQEIARYLLPVGMSASLYHSVNITTLLRYIAVAKYIEDAKEEAMEFAKLIELNLLKLDRELEPLIEFAKSDEAILPDIDLSDIKRRLDIKSDELVKVFDIVEPLNYKIDKSHTSVLRTSQLLLDGSIVGGFSSYLKLSLSADSQNQRHRRSLAPRGKIEIELDYYTPEIVKNSKEALKIYKRANEEAIEFSSKNQNSIYPLLNSHNIELIERNDFSAFHHKAQMRLCYNAQEEIFNITYNQIAQLREFKVKNIEDFLPPCSIRKKFKIYPICPEGARFCGIKVWKREFNELKREI